MNKFLLITGISVGIVAVVSLALWITMLLWNWLMPTIFSLPEITFWQSGGIILLSAILFKKTNYESS